MSIVVFSDVHGNLPALELMLRDAGKADQYICLGDVVNYGPWSRECVELIADLENCVFVAGNHEQMFLAKHFDGANSLVKQFFEHCITSFDRFDLISDLADEYHVDDFLFTHTLENRRIFPDSDVDIGQSTFIGHSHHQFDRLVNGYHLYNVGSVGQNRQYLNLISYAVLFPDVRRVDLRNLAYDESLVINEMKRRNYPPECIDYYEGKPRFA